MKDFRYPLMADVYYATHTQNEYNEMVDTWTVGWEGLLCELHSDKFNSDTRYSIVTNQTFFEFPLLLFGRFKQDIRLDRYGNYHSLTDIMITNLRDECGQRPVFLETAEVMNGSDPNDMDILFEVRSFQPFTNPWGQIEYYRTQAFRMQDQKFDLQDGNGWQL